MEIDRLRATTPRALTTTYDIGMKDYGRKAVSRSEAWTNLPSDMANSRHDSSINPTIEAKMKTNLALEQWIHRES